MNSEDIRADLKRARYNKDTAKVFIPYDSIREIWAGNRLEVFLRTRDATLRTSEIEIARNGLLRTISILIGITSSGWSGWSRFKAIFFPPNDVLADRRRDKNTLQYTEGELEHDSFLGDTNLARLFMIDMWIYFPIVLKGNPKEPYGPEFRLPLVQMDSESREGGFGIVTKEMIPPKQIILSHLTDHLGIPEAPHPVELIVARKRFPKPNYHVEIRQLKLLRSSLSSHKRIVSDLAIFIIGHELNIIMPWADMDLERFLDEGYKEMPSTPCLLDLVKESGKLAAAIEFLHKGLQPKSEWPELQHQAICHADLKPRNILVFKRDNSSTGLWRITDFGISRVAHRDLPGERKHDFGYSTTVDAPPPKGGAYQAPESHAQRRSDIWSFGCILVRIFALGFEPASLPVLDKVRKVSIAGRPLDDRFFQGNPPVLNPNVEAWIQGLPDQYRASFNATFLEEIQKLLHSMLKIDFHKRPSAGKVRGGLHRLHTLGNQPIYSSPDISSSIPMTRPITPNSSTSPPDSSQGSPPASTPTNDPTDAQTPDTESIQRSFTVGLLVSVIKYGGIDEVNELLQNRIDVEQLHEGKRPLIHAIERGSAPVISSLLKYKPDLDIKARSSEGETPLNLAICKGDIDTVEVLLDADAPLNALSKGEKTPLMEAAIHGHVSVASELLRRRADHTICVGQDQLNCLHYAVKNIDCREDLIMAFIDRMDFDQFPPSTPLDGSGDSSRMRNYETPMMLHIRLGLEGHYRSREILWRKKFAALLKGKADVNRRYSQGTPLEISPLEIAVKEKNVEIAKVLVDAGATLPENYQVRSGTSRDMKKIIKRAKRSPEES